MPYKQAAFAKNGVSLPVLLSRLFGGSSFSDLDNLSSVRDTQCQCICAPLGEPIPKHRAMLALVHTDSP